MQKKVATGKVETKQEEEETKSETTEKQPVEIRKIVDEEE